MLHQTIKNQIKEALRAKDTLRLDALRGLNALCLNELIAMGSSQEFLPDDKVTPLIKRSIKQRKDSIEQFQKGGREDLAQREQSELVILSSFLPAMISLQEVRLIVRERIATLKSNDSFDPKNSGKIIGMLIKELSGKADGNDVKKAVEEIL
ncbi:MAG: hypothetical protein A3B11_01925 [Candidatus Taylorbacteria bacterium RIFCSPLOWO2_01_FULL_44_26]|uniref:Glutamyl-tRNA amidotransferase n=2 Tax=Candidatus Tayloriibacteriota TaxID=1817919 RepID=A0A1G2MJN7_9BACT|nr:MAG: hypothetical protein A3D50_01970 [Candidatus Taylorbacteria bacterium RIFCSPHIGHO2_02_FULL_44_12]OHA31432.1 MAG: hypothetical protein A3B11_01925 [Candidatus Taylorbacteria bacterium RIFCSPLOWO2_01_FULL_44_26]